MVPPPVDLSASSGLSVFFLVLCTAIFAGFLAWCTHRAVRLREPLALCVLAGGLMATLIEPMLDNLGLVWFAKDNVAIAFNLFDRSMPAYVVLGYGFFFGGQAFLAHDGLRRGKGAQYLWSLYAGAWVFDLAIESTGHFAGLYRYYGPQPFNLWGIPLWWMFVNPALPVVAGLAFFRLGDQLQRFRSLLAVVLLPIIYGAVYGGVAWPMFVAFHSTTNTAVLYACAGVTATFAVLVVWLSISLLLPPASSTSSPRPTPGAAEAERAPSPV